MRVGEEIGRLRRERGMTQEEFGALFHVTRQTVSNWENSKSYPDLETLVRLSEEFGVTLDQLMKGDRTMIRTMDRERLWGKQAKRAKSITEFCTGGGTGALASCLLSPDSVQRTLVIVVSLILIAVGWYRRSRYDAAVEVWLEEQEG